MTPKALAIVGFFLGLSAIVANIAGAEGADRALGLLSALVFTAYAWAELRRA